MISIALEMVAEVEVNFMLQNGAFLFAAPDGKRLMRKAPSSIDWLPAGINNNSQDYKWGLIHNGFIYWGKDGDTDVYETGGVQVKLLQVQPYPVSTQIVTAEDYMVELIVMMAGEG